MAQYTYTRGLVKPFIHAGMGNAMVLKTTKNDLYNPQTKRRYAAVDGVNKHEESAIVGIGARVSRFQLEGRFSTASGWIPYNSASISVNSFQVIAGVRF